MKLPTWMDRDGLPQIAGVDGGLLRRLAEAAARGARNDEELASITAVCEAIDASDWLWELIERWQFKGSGEDQMARLFSWLATDDDVTRLGELLRQTKPWTDHVWARIAPRVRALNLLAAVDSPLGWLEVARFRDHTNVDDLYEHAGSVLWTKLRDQGWEPRDLNALCAPTLGFEEGVRPVGLCDRNLLINATDLDDVHLVDDTGRRFRCFPRRRSDDDAERHAAARARWHALREQIAEVVDRAVFRLEQAMIVGQRWSHRDWRDQWFNHPLLAPLVRELVWVAHVGDELHPFIFTPEGEAWSPDEGDINLESSWTFGVAHPTALDVERWTETLADHEIVQRFEQVGRVRRRWGRRQLDPELLGSDHPGWEMRARAVGRTRDLFVLRIGDDQARVVIEPGLAVTSAGRLLSNQQLQQFISAEVYNAERREVIAASARIQMEIEVFLARNAAG